MYYIYPVSLRNNSDVLDMDMDTDLPIVLGFTFETLDYVTMT